MPAFIPRFVDLVRVTTSTQGTGPIAAGPATQGFANFAESLAVGDQFYYCLQGVDKPAEREVGRGILLANGTIGRQAINGTLTNFTLGTKTLSLVAGAEWFRQQQQAFETIAALESSQVASRSALAAVSTAVPGSTRYLTELGREGSFCFEAGNFAARVAVDPERAIFIPSATDPTGSSGSWVRKFTGPCNAQWWGFLPGIGDVSSKLVAALSLLREMSGVQVRGYSRGSVSLYIPGASTAYAMGSTTIDLRHSPKIYGDSTMFSAATRLEWSGNVTGFRSQVGNTTGANGIQAGDGNQSSAGFELNGLYLRGGYSGTEAEAHGIHLRDKGTIRDCYIDNFGGDGIFSRAAAGLGAPVEGNSNLFLIERTTIAGCRNGLYTDSADVNAGNVAYCNFAGNRQWGVWDSSFLGNTYTGCHAQANGTDGAISSIPTAVTYLGNRYALKRDQAASAGSTAPSGTTASNAVWEYWSAGGTYFGIVPWVAAVVVREGGGYRTDDVNARNVFTGCYSEGDQAPNLFGGPTLVVGGLMDNIRKFGGVLSGLDNTLITGKNLLVNGTLVVAGEPSGGAMIGPYEAATASDGQTIFRTTNISHRLLGQYWASGAPVADIGEVSFSYGNGILYNAANAGWSHIFRVNNAGVLNIASTGIDLATGKDLRVNAVKVVGAQGAALADPAAITSVAGTVAAAAPTKAEFDALVAEFNKDRTDLAAVRTVQVAMLARLRATTGHGLIA